MGLDDRRDRGEIAMTVKELIEWLENEPQDAEVVIDTWIDGWENIAIGEVDFRDGKVVLLS